MARQRRYAPGGVIYHVLNRANGKLPLFEADGDFLAMERVLVEAAQRTPMRILDWCIMSNHWHLILWPQRDGELTAFTSWLTLTHTQRWKHAHEAVGLGHLYQDRFKSFPVQDDHHLLTVLRYVERNPVRAGLAPRAENWRWGSCFVRQSKSHGLRSLLRAWPIERPRNWLERVNLPQTEAEESAMREHIRRGRPFGNEGWVSKMAHTLKLEHTLRRPGHPMGDGERLE